MIPTTDPRERLPELLDELAQSTPIESDRTHFDPNASMPLVDARYEPRSRYVVAAAAVALLVVGVGALALVRPSEPDTAPAPATQPAGTRADSVPATAGQPLDTVATPLVEPAAESPQPVEPTLFPAIDEPPGGLELTGTVGSVPASSLWSEALVWRPDGDSIAITVQADPFEISPMSGNPPTTAEVFGQTATVYDYGTAIAIPEVHVTWGTGPYYLASGSDPLAFLEQASPDVFTATIDADEQPVLTIGQLPDGYEVAAAPNIVGHATTTATLSIGADNYDISVSTRNPAVMMALVGPIRRVEVNGQPGWMFDTSTSTLTEDVTWKVDDTTYAYLKVNDGTNAFDTLELARSILFLDRDSWEDRYLAPGAGEES